MLLAKFLDILFPKSKREEDVHNIATGVHALTITPQLTETPAGVHVTTLTKYESKYVREVIHSLKFHNSRESAKILAHLLNDYLTEYFAEKSIFGIDTNNILILPVPISKERRRARGFNQIERILRVLVKINNEYKKNINTTLLVRHRHTTPQVSLHKHERLGNLKNAFSLTQPKLLHGKLVIIVDDVATTGATLAEISRTLHSAKSAPTEIELLALAGA